MRYLIVDGMLSGTGVRDAVEGGYLEPGEVGVSTPVAERVALWVARYEEAHYHGFHDKERVSELDREGRALCLALRLELRETKIDYFSAAKMRQQIVGQCELRAGATSTEIDTVVEALGVELPDDHRMLLATSNGLEGIVGEEGHLSFWSTSELVTLNEAYCVGEFLPGVILIATDGAGTGFGFRRSHGDVEYISVPLVGMETDAVEVCGPLLADVFRLVMVG